MTPERMACMWSSDHSQCSQAVVLAHVDTCTVAHWNFLLHLFRYSEGICSQMNIYPEAEKILFRNGDLIRLSPGRGGRCGRGRGMGGQDGLRAGADAR